MRAPNFVIIAIKIKSNKWDCAIRQRLIPSYTTIQQPIKLQNNSDGHNFALLRNISWSTLVHEISCCLLVAEPLSAKILMHCQLDPKEEIRWNVNTIQSFSVMRRVFKITENGGHLATCRYIYQLYDIKYTTGDNAESRGDINQILLRYPYKTFHSQSKLLYEVRQLFAMMGPVAKHYYTMNNPTQGPFILPQ